MFFCVNGACYTILHILCCFIDEQLDIVEKIYGVHLKFNFNEKDIEKILNEEFYYAADIKNRVLEILLQQKRKYQYLFL